MIVCALMGRKFVHMSIKGPCYSPKKLKEYGSHFVYIYLTANCMESYKKLSL